MPRHYKPICTCIVSLTWHSALSGMRTPTLLRCFVFSRIKSTICGGASKELLLVSSQQSTAIVAPCAVQANCIRAQDPSSATELPDATSIGRCTERQVENRKTCLAGQILAGRHDEGVGTRQDAAQDGEQACSARLAGGAEAGGVRGYVREAPAEKYLFAHHILLNNVFTRL